MDIDVAAPALDRWHAVGPPQGYSLGWSKLDPHIRILRGEWTLVVGYPSHGKTHWVYSAAINLAWHEGVRCAIFGPENIPYERQVKGLAQKFMGKRLRDFDADELALSKMWLKRHFWFVEPVEMTFESLLAQFRRVIREQKIQVCFIDPWNEIEHEVPRGMTETQYIARCLIRLRRFAEAMHVHIFVVAHPSKINVKRQPGEDAGKRPVVMLSDTSGSSHFENKCFFGISIWRNPMAEGDEKHVNKVYILKARNEDAGHVGMVPLYWDPASTNYRDTQDAAMPESCGEKYKRQLQASFGDWRSAVRKHTGAEKKKLEERPVEWKVLKTMAFGTNVGFDDGKCRAVVAAERDEEGRIQGWLVTVWRPDKTLEWSTNDKDDAMDWAEKAAMQGGTQ